MRVLVEWGDHRTPLRYTVQGSNLGQASSVLRARGHQAGLFSWHVAYHLYCAHRPTVTRIKFSPTSSILMPTWPQYRIQPRLCQEEWDSIWNALMRHEVGHADLFESRLDALVAHLAHEPPMNSSKCRLYIDYQLNDIKKRERQYDINTSHGSRGVDITISRDCVGPT